MSKSLRGVPSGFDRIHHDTAGKAYDVRNQRREFEDRQVGIRCRH